MGSHGLHGDTMPDMKALSHRGSARAQSDGRKPLAHAVTAVVSIAVSLLAGHFLVHGNPGAQGPSGPAGGSVVKTASDAGVCAYFGPDSNGVTRFQVFEPRADVNGAYCLKGKLILVTPKK